MRTGLAIVLLAFMVATTQAAARYSYRYTTPDGDVVITDSLPPGQARFGYEVLDAETGQVVERVPPQLSDEEFERERKRQEALQKCERELQRLRGRYSSLEDIAAARDRDLRLLDEERQNRRYDLARARSELDRLQQRAAADERAGRSVSRQTRQSIASLEARIAELEIQIEQQDDERARVLERYERETQRFRDGTCDDPGPQDDAAPDPGREDDPGPESDVPEHWEAE